MIYKKILLYVFCTLILNITHAQTSALQAYWDDGLKFKTADEKYKFSVGGRIHYDAAFLGHSSTLDSAFGDAKNKTEIRRARLSFEGTINNTLAYEVGFSLRDQIEFADIYLAFLKAPFFDRITVGHFREPFSLEEVTSSNQTVFLERSLTSAFGPSRNTGIMLQKSFNQEQLNVYTGLFRITDDLGADKEGNEKYSFSNRIVYNPVYDTSNNKTLHFGLGFNRFNPIDYIYQVEQSNESELSPSYINTGEIENIKSVTQLGGEIGFSNNKLFLQSEYIYTLAKHRKNIQNITDLTKNFNSFYVLGSYFLKGGVRKYSKRGNRFSSVALTEKQQDGSLKGAWELGLRLSHINLGRGDYYIHKMTDATLGLNRYFNSNTRIMMNYVHSFMNQSYFANALLFRVQVTF